MSAERRAREKGSTLIVVIMIAAFMLAVGGVLILLTNTGKRISTNVALQDQAFNAAEAGFEKGKMTLSSYLLNGTWTTVDEYTVTTPTGFDLPTYSNYFRKLTDKEVLAAVSASTTGVLFYDQTYVTTTSGSTDSRYTYTVFLINDEAGGGTADPTDVLMICIGCVKSGSTVLASSRLEILLSTSAD